jgi:hypothetical protein
VCQNCLSLDWLQSCLLAYNDILSTNLLLVYHPVVPLCLCVFLPALARSHSALRRVSAAVWLACLWAAWPATGKLVGYGIQPYSPECAFSCLRCLESYMLDCTALDAPLNNMDDSSMTSPQCYASSVPWLTTMAWCLHTYCPQFHLKTSELETWWENQVTGTADVAPMWGYTQALANISTTPTVEAGTATMNMNMGSMATAMPYLNTTSLLPYDTWLPQYNTLWSVQRENVVESGYRYAFGDAGIYHARRR